MSNPSSKASMHAELSRLGASQSEDFQRTLAALSQDWLTDQWLPESAWQEIHQLELDVVSLWQTIDNCISLATQLTSGFMPNGWSGPQNEAVAPAQTTAVASGQAAVPTNSPTKEQLLADLRAVTQISAQMNMAVQAQATTAIRPSKPIVKRPNAAEAGKAKEQSRADGRAVTQISRAVQSQPTQAASPGKQIVKRPNAAEADAVSALLRAKDWAGETTAAKTRPPAQPTDELAGNLRQSEQTSSYLPTSRSTEIQTKPLAQTETISSVSGTPAPKRSRSPEEDPASTRFTTQQVLAETRRRSVNKTQPSEEQSPMGSFADDVQTSEERSMPWQTAQSMLDEASTKRLRPQQQPALAQTKMASHATPENFESDAQWQDSSPEPVSAVRGLKAFAQRLQTLPPDELTEQALQSETLQPPTVNRRAVGQQPPLATTRTTQNRQMDWSTADSTAADEIQRLGITAVAPRKQAMSNAMAYAEWSEEDEVEHAESESQRIQQQPHAHAQSTAKAGVASTLEPHPAETSRRERIGIAESAAKQSAALPEAMLLPLPAQSTISEDQMTTILDAVERAIQNEYRRFYGD